MPRLRCYKYNCFRKARPGRSRYKMVTRYGSLLLLLRPDRHLYHHHAVPMTVTMPMSSPVPAPLRTPVFPLRHALERVGDPDGRGPLPCGLDDLLHRRLERGCGHGRHRSRVSVRRKEVRRRPQGRGPFGRRGHCRGRLGRSGGSVVGKTEGGRERGLLARKASVRS
jgi:hypothetical protein